MQLEVELHVAMELVVELVKALELMVDIKLPALQAIAVKLAVEIVPKVR